MVRRGSRREEILDAAAHLFARRGFDGVSLADLADTVGVTAPALYRHFSDKEAILTSLIEATAQRMVGIAEARQDDPDALASCVAAYTAEALDRPDPALTYLRERHRLRGDAAAGRVALERALLDLLVRPYSRAYPKLDGTDMLHRVIGALGALRGCAERGVRIPRPAADEFVAGGVLALLAAPAASAPVRPATRSPGWTPEQSPRERILGAALPLFRERGFAGVGFGEIGEVAGVGATNVGRYFDSKEQILVDAYDRAGAKVEVGLDEAIGTAADAKDALDRMLESYCRLAFDSVDLVVVVSDNRGALPSEERPRLRRRDRRVMALWRAVVAEVRPDLRPTEVDTAVAAVLPIINMFPQQLHGSVPAPESVITLVRAFVLGVKPQRR
ncbi:MAG: TetR/AcrR family transcriptional regulator [Mycobacterium sp.]|nr:MAG: TetR/AcrR family transcriptional regulator [Mycobacterium sp.]